MNKTYCEKCGKPTEKYLKQLKLQEIYKAGYRAGISSAVSKIEMGGGPALVESVLLDLIRTKVLFPYCDECGD